MKTEELEYGFYGRLSEEFPSQIIVDLTEFCNYACTHCPHANLENLGVFHGAKLDFELIQKMVQEVKEYGKGCTQQIRYTAEGEPMLHTKIFEILKYTVDNADTFVSLTTNGSLLTDSNVEKLLDTGLSMIDISLDAYSKEVYEKVRVGGDFDKVRNGVLQLLKRKKERDSKIRVVVSFVKQPLNETEVKSFKDFWEEAGVDYVIIRDLHTAGGTHLENKIISDLQERKPCVYPWERITLGATGKLDFCPVGWSGKSVIMDYRECTIHELWHSEFYENLRKSHLTNCFKSGHACLDCEDWKIVRWPQEGQRAYGDLISDFTKGEE